MPPLRSLNESVKPQIVEMTSEYLRENFNGEELVRIRNGNDGEVGNRNNNRISRHQIITVSILCFVNLINYMDRYVIAGLLVDISNMYKLSESEEGLLQTAFILVYMVMAPLYGYLGDRFNRKILMATGVFLWSLTTLIGSFMNNYSGFLIMRCFVGIGEASYSTIAPTLISDIFVSNTRSKMLALFYFAIPVGSGLGYIIGSEVAHIAERLLPPDEAVHAWRWGLRVTPIMGLVAVLLIILVLKEPPRGESEGGGHLKNTSFLKDLKHLISNRSYVLTTIAFTCVTYVAGAVAWWGPKYVELGVSIQTNPNVSTSSVPFIFGLVAMLAGLLGVPLGSFAGQKFRDRYPAADPVVCGIGLLLSFPLICWGLIEAGMNNIVAFVVVFFGQVFLNLNWAVVSDMVLYIVLPTRRSSAEAFQILISHAFGDAGSPYIVGLVAEAFKPFVNKTSSSYSEVMVDSSMNFINGSFSSYPNSTASSFSPFGNGTHVVYPTQDYVNFKALQYSLMICIIAEILAAIFFFWAGVYITKDKEICDRTIAGAIGERESPEALVPSIVHHFADDTGNCPPNEPSRQHLLNNSYDKI